MSMEVVLLIVSAALTASGVAAIGVGLRRLRRGDSERTAPPRTRAAAGPSWDQVFTPAELARLQALKARLERHEVQR